MLSRETTEDLATDKRGDSVSGVKTTGRRALLSAWSQDGFSLIELVITVTIMTILTLGIIPMMKISVKRQKEQQLRETLRQIRMAIDDFRRDTVGMPCAAGGIQSGGQAGQAGQGGQGGFNQPYFDPRSKVVISDCTIFGVDNPDHYPPDLETLVNGVNVLPRGAQAAQVTGGAGLGGRPGLLDSQLSTKKKVYLREIPVDPITGKAEWDLRSSYDTYDSTSWGGENVFDVRSKARGTAMNGERYSDW